MGCGGGRSLGAAGAVRPYAVRGLTGGQIEFRAPDILSRICAACGDREDSSFPSPNSVLLKRVHDGLINLSFLSHDSSAHLRDCSIGEP